MIVLHAAETIKGGVATVINSLVDYQVEQPEIDQVICLVPSDQVDNLISPPKLQVFQFQRKGRNILGMLAFFFSFLKLIIQNKPDVIHLHSSFAGLMGRIAILLSGRKHKTKVIYCPHAFGFLMETSPLKKKVYSFVELKLSKFTDKIICVSQNEYNHAKICGFDENKLSLIKNGVKVKHIINKRNLNKKDSYKILFVGRFDYQKGIDILSEALLKLTKLDSNINYEFNLVGEAVNSEGEVFFSGSSNIKVNLLGWLRPTEIEQLYLNHDAIVIPSRWEGFAMVPLEAMSYGLPIIASNIEAFKELDANNEKYIIFFENPENLAKILFNINNLTLEDNRKKSLEVLASNFNENDMKSKTYKLYA